MTITISDAIVAGQTALGIELGSIRIKAVLTGPHHTPVAAGSRDWENQLVDRMWNYSLEAVWSGLGMFAVWGAMISILLPNHVQLIEFGRFFTGADAGQVVALTGYREVWIVAAVVVLVAAFAIVPVNRAK